MGLITTEVLWVFFLWFSEEILKYVSVLVYLIWLVLFKYYTVVVSLTLCHLVELQIESMEERNGEKNILKCFCFHTDLRKNLTTNYCSCLTSYRS